VNYQQELLYTCRGDAGELLEMHYHEIALNKDKIKLNPDWEAYEALEDSNQLRIFTVRDDGKLVGYSSFIVMPMLHNKGYAQAVSDTVYLHPEYRKGYTGVNLLKFSEKCLKEDGVTNIHVYVTFRKDFGNIMDHLGYNPTETLYSKYTGE